MVTIERFDTSEAFARRALPVLEAHEAENNLPLGILASIRAGEFTGEAYYAVACEDGRDILAVLRTLPRRALLSYLPADPSPELMDAVARDLLDASAGELPGFLGDSRVTSALAAAFERVAGRRAEVDSAQRTYALTEVLPADRASGRMRPAAASDRELVQRWLQGFMDDLVMHDETAEDPGTVAERYLAADPTQRGMVLWEHDGRPVSMAGYAGPTPGGIRVAAVYTPPEHRRHGYASALVAELSRRLLEQGHRRCFLFTELANPTSNHIYQEIGYRAISDVDSWRLG